MGPWTACPACGVALHVCPACLAVIAASTGRGRPRVYRSDACRWRAGRRAARQRARARAGDQLDAWLAALEPRPVVRTRRTKLAARARAGRLAPWPG